MEDELDLYEKSENAGDGMGNGLLRESILGKTFKIIAKVECSYGVRKFKPLKKSHLKPKH